MARDGGAAGVDPAGVAAACGFASSATARTAPEVERLHAAIDAGTGPLLAAVKAAPEKLPLVPPPRDGAHLKNRFREALLGAEAHFQS